MSFLRNIFIAILATTWFFGANAGRLVKEEVANNLTGPTPRYERFVSNGKEIVTSEDKIIPPSLRGSCVGTPGEGKDCVDISTNILRAVETPTATDAKLIQGLQNEFKHSQQLIYVWGLATSLLAEKKNKTGDWAKVPEHDIALIAFTLPDFFIEFNEATRNLKSVKEAASFKFLNYYNLLLRGIRNGKGQPLKISRTDKLYRGCSVTTTELALKQGERFLFKQFTSTSLKIDSAASFAGGVTLFVINGINQGPVGNQNVLGLEKHSQFDYEKEVILDPFVVFKVTKIEQEPGKRYVTVHLTESN